jgi:hypothetical protein
MKFWTQFKFSLLVIYFTSGAFLTAAPIIADTLGGQEQRAAVNDTDKKKVELWYLTTAAGQTHQLTVANVSEWKKMYSSITECYRDTVMWKAAAKNDPADRQHLYKIAAVKTKSPLYLTIKGHFAKDSSATPRYGKSKNPGKFEVILPKKTEIVIENFVEAPTIKRRDRTTVGVGEFTYVRITNSHLGNPVWKMETGANALGEMLFIDSNRKKEENWHQAVFLAKQKTPNNGICKIKAVFPVGAPKIKQFEIKEPESEIGVKLTTDAQCDAAGLPKISTYFGSISIVANPRANYDSTKAGAYLPLICLTKPDNVSFSNIKVLEIGTSPYDKPQNVTVYFRDSKNQHKPNTEWSQLGLEHNHWFDCASFYNFSSPWRDQPQSFEWHIPVQWKMSAEYNGKKYEGTPKQLKKLRIQKMSILDKVGTSKIEKLGQSSMRTPD